MNDSPIALLDEAQTETLRLVAGIGSDLWDAPTPCEGWSVRQLLNHLVGGNRWFAALARGEEAERSAFAGDNLGEDPVGAYRDSAWELVEAFQSPGAVERTYIVPAGTLPGPAAVMIRVVEAVTHGWDLARATGQSPGYARGVVRAALATSRRLPRRAGPGGPFAPSTEPGPDATELDRLAALLGRQTV